MAKLKVKDVVEAMSKPLIESLGMELVDVEYLKEGKDFFLRIYIYRDVGVSIDDCVAVNKLIDEELEKIDPIQDAYILEVSSPGLDRPFRTDRDFERYAGEDVEVLLFQPVEGKKLFEGKLIGLKTLEKESFVVIEANGLQEEFEKSRVATVKRIIKF